MDVTLSPRARTTVVWIAVAVGILILFSTAGALAPFVWAIITAYILSPFVSLVQRKTRLPRQLITVWVYLVIALVLAILIVNLVPQLLQQVDQIQKVTLPRMISDIEGWFLARRAEDSRLAALDPEFVQRRLDLIGEQLGELLSTEALPLVIETFSFAIELFVFLIASFYLVTYGDRFVQAIRNFMSRRYHREFDSLLVEINSTLGAYLRGQLLLLVIMSTASYVALRILDVDYALSVAVATGFLELIPLIGPWSAGTIAVTIAFFQPTAPFDWSNATLAIVVALVYFALRQIEDVFVIPVVIGRIVHLNPLLVIFVLVIGTTIGGPLGLILAVPIAAVLKIIVSFFYQKVMAREQRFVDVIGSRQALADAASRFPERTNATVVLLIEPGVLGWNDLDLVRSVSEAAFDHAVALSVVTTDGIAGSLATASGIPTTTVPVLPAPEGTSAAPTLPHVATG
jgi:predicted PurR-regulated permease PerM